MTDSAAASIIDIGPQVARRLGGILAVWGAASTVAGGIAALTGRSPGVRAFGLQSAMWGSIDVAIAGVGALQSTPPSARTLRTVLLVNSALDVGYMAAGAHIAVRRPSFGGRVSAAQARGHGWAVVVQGAALFALDLGHAQMARPARR